MLLQPSALPAAARCGAPGPAAGPRGHAHTLICKHAGGGSGGGGATPESL